MKARKKGTNEPFEEIDCLQFKGSYVVYPVSMIEFKNESDVEYWEQLRHKAAIAAMQGMLSAPLVIVDEFEPNPSKERIAELAVSLSDALIEHLKEK